MTSKKHFFYLVKTYRKPLISISVLSILISLLYVGFAYISKFLLDYLNQPQFIIFLYVLVGIVIVEIALRIVSTYIKNLYLEKIKISMKERLYASILQSDTYNLSKFQESDLLTRMMSDVKIISTGVISIIPSATLAVSRIIFAITVLFFIDYIFAFILLIGGVIVFLLTRILRKKNKKMQEEIQKSEAETLGFYREGISNLDVLKVFNNRAKIEGKQSQINNRFFQANIKKDNFNLMVNSGFLAIMRFSFLFGILWCAFRFDQGITIGSLLAIVQLISQITIPFTNLSGVLPSYYSCLASIDRYNEIIDITKDDKKRKVEFNYLEAKDVSFKYDREQVITQSSFKIAKSDFVVITANSGRGKTTLIKVLMGLYRPSAGRVLINGKIDASKVNSLYAYLPQKNLTVSGTIKENLLFFVDSATDSEINRALELACIKEEIERFPKGIDTYISDYGSGLSEGQLQRLSIARVILANREVIVLDEATSALDSHLEKRILENIKSLNKTTIFISHKPRTVEFATKVLTIENGRVKYGKINKDN